MQVIAAIKAIYELVLLAKDLVRFVEANKDEAWFQQSHQFFKGLREAKTKEELKDASKKISDLFNSIS